MLPVLIPSLYKNYLRDKKDESKVKYNSYKNKLTKIIRMAEKQYYTEKFELVKGDIRKTWQTIKNVINGPEWSRKQEITEIKFDNALITDNEILANKFNSFFPILAQIWPTRFQKLMVIYLII
jgi:hypothetical protein